MCCTMLVEIMCDEFKDHGKPRGCIRLHAGLNTVMGSASGSNSIGKSTFLMIIDFVFGGDDYSNPNNQQDTKHDLNQPMQSDG